MKGYVLLESDWKRLKKIEGFWLSWMICTLLHCHSFETNFVSVILLPR
jgi:hypothetical protein